MKLLEFDIGNIVCHKDSYDIVNNTLGPSLCRAINNIIKTTTTPTANASNGTASSNYDGNAVDHWDIDGYFVLCRSSKNTAYTGSYEASTEIAGAVHVAPITRFMTGDLAFYHMMAGRESASTHYCHLCLSKHSIWQRPNHD